MNFFSLNSAERRSRLATMADKIRAAENRMGLDPDEPRIDIEKIKQTLNAAAIRHKKTPSIWSDEFADPVDLIEWLADHVNIDQDMLLAAILYPTVRPVGNNGVDRNGLSAIEDQYGREVRRLCRRTLKFRALGTIKREGAVSEKEHNENVRMFDLMTIWAGLDPRVFATRIGNATLRFKKINDKRDQGDYVDLPLDVEQEMNWRAENVLAPLAYVAGWGKARRSLMDEAFRFANPEEFRRVRRALDTTSDGLVKARELPLLKQQIASFMHNTIGLSADNYIIEVDQKGPASAYAKAVRKDQNIDALGDRYRFRIILKEMQGGRPRSIDELSMQCREIYAQISKIYGRGNKSNKDRYLALAETDPRVPYVPVAKRIEGIEYTPEQLKPNDARYDNYYSDPKASGYQSIQDEVLILIGSKLVECECQIVDEISHENNQYGPKAGHVWYKTGLNDHLDSLQAWAVAAQAVAEGREPPEVYLYVFGPNYKVYEFRQGNTVADYVQKVFGAAAVNEVTGATIRSDDNIVGVPRSGATRYALDEPLRNGDLLTVHAKGRPLEAVV